jgi:hypothetical protein
VQQQSNLLGLPFFERFVSKSDFTTDKPVALPRGQEVLAEVS